MEKPGLTGQVKLPNLLNIHTRREVFFLLSGYAILHPPMAVEKLGVRENQRPENGPRPGHHLRSGEATEEKATVRLSLLKPEEPQLLGLPILLL